MKFTVQALLSTGILALCVKDSRGFILRQPISLITGSPTQTKHGQLYMVLETPEKKQLDGVELLKTQSNYLIDPLKEVR